MSNNNNDDDLPPGVFRLTDDAPPVQQRIAQLMTWIMSRTDCQQQSAVVSQCVSSFDESKEAAQSSMAERIQILQNDCKPQYETLIKCINNLERQHAWVMRGIRMEPACSPAVEKWRQCLKATKNRRECLAESFEANTCGLEAIWKMLEREQEE